MTIESNRNQEARLWQRIHGALDQHRDPLADPQLMQALGNCPAVAAQLGSLLESIAHLSPRPAAPIERATPLTLLLRTAIQVAATAAAVLLAYGGWRSLPRESISAPAASHDSDLPALALRREPAPFQIVMEHTDANRIKRVSISQDSRSTTLQPLPVHRWLPAEFATERSWRLPPGDTLTYERVTAFSTRN